MNIQCWFPLGLTVFISLLSKGLPRVFSNTTVQKHQLFGAQLSSQNQLYIYIHISPLFWISFPYSSPENTEVEFPVLYSRFSLVIYFQRSINSVYVSIPISQFIPLFLFLPWHPYTPVYFSNSFLCLSYL